MAGFVLGLYPDFSCIADRCPATCCAGWKIIVDQEAYQRFLQIDHEKLRQDILENLVEQDGVLRFVNRTDGTCAMLDPDGLCRIQRNTREEMLCNTCRKFPRITAGITRQDRENGTLVWLSLAASCPVVAEYILDGSVSWLWLDDKGRCHSLSRSQWEWFRKTTAMPVGEAVKVSWKSADLFDVFVDLSLDILDVLVRFPEIPYLEQSFDLYDAEVPDLAAFGNFFTETEHSWRTFVQQYQCYRYPSRYLEFQDEDRTERAKQIQGELLVMRIMLCSRYVLRGKWEHTDLLEVLHWVYRFSAHGKAMAEQVHAMIVSWKNKYLDIAYKNICLVK